MNQDGVLANLRRGTVEFCVLAVIRRAPCYAAELVQELGATGLLTSEGTLYPVLSRLRADGHVKTEWVESTAGPPRRYYRITRQGSAALAEFRGHWVAFTRSVNHLLTEDQA